MQTVKFTQMQDGTREEYEFLDSLEDEYKAGLPDRILEALGKLEHSISGYRISRLEHSLQGATRAFRAGESEEMIIAVLLHDIGDELATYSHSEMAAAILRPFVPDDLYWIVKHHGVFQMYYYAHHCGGNRNSREIYRDHPYYQAAIDFCHNYDQNCFDPEYNSEPLEFFDPIVRRVMSQPRFSDAEQVARYGEATTDATA
jgi:predicted HD phosphohydrolase